MGKRVQGQAFLDGVISHGAHFCTYLLGTDMEMNTPEGLQAHELGDRLWRLDRRAGLGPAPGPALAARHGHGPGRRGRRGDRPGDPDRPADDPQAPGRAGGGGRLHAQGRLGVRVLRPEGFVGGPGRPRLAGAPPVRPLQRGLPPPPGDQGRTAPSAPAQPDDRGGRADRVQQGRGGQRPARGQHPLRPRPGVGRPERRLQARRQGDRLPQRLGHHVHGQAGPSLDGLVRAPPHEPVGRRQGHPAHARRRRRGRPGHTACPRSASTSWPG